MTNGMRAVFRMHFLQEAEGKERRSGSFQTQFPLCLCLAHQPKNGACALLPSHFVFLNFKVFVRFHLVLICENSKGATVHSNKKHWAFVVRVPDHIRLFPVLVLVRGFFTYVTAFLYFILDYRFCTNFLGCVAAR